MKSILQQLYEGELHPSEQYCPQIEEYKIIRQKQYQHYEDFIHTLNSFDTSLQSQFVRIMDEQLETVPYEFSQMFIEGFRLGARMMIEIYGNDISDKK
ncbi:MAG: hypothetical protein KHZ58_18510 [Hungatella hathewayi]|nr:hypothetical protein [Hungatella hathewayi]